MVFKTCEVPKHPRIMYLNRDGRSREQSDFVTLSTLLPAKKSRPTQFLTGSIHPINFWRLKLIHINGPKNLSKVRQITNSGQGSRQKTLQSVIVFD